MPPRCRPQALGVQQQGQAGQGPQTLGMQQQGQARQGPGRRIYASPRPPVLPHAPRSRCWHTLVQPRDTQNHRKRPPVLLYTGRPASMACSAYVPSHSYCRTAPAGIAPPVREAEHGGLRLRPTFRDWRGQGLVCSLRLTHDGHSHSRREAPDRAVVDALEGQGCAHMTRVVGRCGCWRVGGGLWLAPAEMGPGLAWPE